MLEHFDFEQLRHAGLSVGTYEIHVAGVGAECFPVGARRRVQTMNNDKLLGSLPPVDDATSRNSSATRRSARSGRARRLVSVWNGVLG